MNETSPAPRVPDRPPRSREEIAGYLAAFTNYETARPLPPARREWGPSRAAHLLDRLGLLPLPFPVVQIAGSKGKGSTALWLETLLRRRGCSVGTYLSPHLERLEERIRIDGADVEEAELREGLEAIHPHLVRLEPQNSRRFPTFFDLWTALAVQRFVRRGVDAALLEVGLGGPLDSTSAVPHDIGVLTTIDLEHRQELGERVEEIAREKARIARSGRPFVLAEPETASGRAARGVAEERGALVREVRLDARVPPTVAEPQARNLATALVAFDLLQDSPATADEVQQAAAQVSLPGRLELLPGPPPLLVDSAHTPRSLAHFRARLRDWSEEAQARPALLVGFLEGKEWQAGLEVFAPEAAGMEWLVTLPDSPRGLDPRTVSAFLRRFGVEPTLLPRPRDAMERLRELGRGGRPVAVTGSTYLAGWVRKEWRTASG